MTPKVLPEALIEELLAAAEKATPGPWYQTGAPWFRDGTGVLAGSPDGNVAYLIADTDDFALPRDEYEGFPLGDKEDDARFIALANPQTISALIAEVKAARASRVLQDEGVVVPWPGRQFCETAERNASALAEWIQGEDDKQVALDAALAIRTLLSAILPSTIGGSVGVSEESPSAICERVEERLCECGAAGSREEHEDWCPWIGSEWHRWSSALTAALSPAISGEPTDG